MADVVDGSSEREMKMGLCGFLFWFFNGNSFSFSFLLMGMLETLRCNVGFEKEKKKSRRKSSP